MHHKLPDKLYHYTSPEGFSGIIKNKMWASDIRYLNDSTELRYALDVTINEVRKMLRKEYQNDDEPFLEQLEKQLKNIYELLETDNDTGIFVCSFSGLEDRLSQWRGYGNGYCISFDREKLESVAAQHFAKFAPCLYREDEQLQKIREALKEAHMYFQDELKAAPSKHQDTQTSAQLATNLFTVVFMVGTTPFIKHPSFEEEEEWRLSLCPEIYGPPVFLLPRSRHLRMGKSRVIIPYIEVSLIGHWTPYGTLPFRNIYVGPTAAKDIAKKSAEEFLRGHDVDDCEVANSRIPFRPL
jgi:Protein of unknown function (DUF2971)